jgi:hypothetical protein
MSWLLDNRCLRVAPTGYIGFVYLIINQSTGKKYLGKKLLTAAGYKQVKKKRKKIRIESNWKDYWGSNDLLLEDIKTLGKKNFKRHIIKFCKTKSECSHNETYYIFRTGAIHKPDYYNFWVMCKIRKPHLANLIVNEAELDAAIEKLGILL